MGVERVLFHEENNEWKKVTTQLKTKLLFVT